MFLLRRSLTKVMGHAASAGKTNWVQSHCNLLNLLRATFCYAVFSKDYDRCRILYTNALAAMEKRGPDVQLLLFAFAIFCFVTRVRRGEHDTNSATYALDAVRILP